MKGSYQRRANGWKPVDIPGNSANRAIGINAPGYYPNWQRFQKLKPNHGKANLNNGRKGYYSEMNARRQMHLDTNGRKHHSAKIETPRVSESKTKILPNWQLNPNYKRTSIKGIETFTINNRNPSVSNSWNQMDKNSNGQDQHFFKN